MYNESKLWIVFAAVFSNRIVDQSVDMFDRTMVF